MQTKNRTKQLAVLAMLSALAYVAVVVCRIPVVLFLKYEPKDVIITLGGFLYGPLSAVAISVVTAFVEMFTISDTGIWGLLMNILSSCAFAGTASLIYHRRRTLVGAAIALLAGVVATTSVMLLWNYLVTPLYMKVPRETVVQLLIPAFLPFNLLKGTLNAALLMLLYQPVVTALRRARLVPPSSTKKSGVVRTYVSVAVIALVVVGGCVLAVLAMRGVI